MHNDKMITVVKTDGLVVKRSEG